MQDVTPAAPHRNGPSWPLYASDIPRAAAGYPMFLLARPLLRTAPKGDGHPVLVLPGLMAGDGSTRPLRGYLRELGYHVHGWRLGRNIGPTRSAVEGMGRRLLELSERHGRTISVIGWSLGGIYAREMARRRPDALRQVITLGTPFGASDPRETRAYRAFERFAHLHDQAEVAVRREADRGPLPVPSTSIYSKLDGIVPWRACLDTPGPTSENVEVFGSHIGLGHNPAVLWVIADRLAQSEGEWNPFRATSLAAKLLFRPPSSPSPSSV